MEQVEFKIASRTEQFRVMKLRAIEVLALQTQVNFDNLEQTEKLFSFILEHTEVQCNGTWFPVKEKGEDTFYPQGIDEDMVALNHIISHFVANVLNPLFTKSKESSQK